MPDPQPDPSERPEPPAPPTALVPPDDPDEWTHEQWCDWMQAIEDEPDDEPARPRRRIGFGGSAMGAAMLGLEQAMYGKVSRPDVMIEVEADGQDDGLVLLDPDDPGRSTVTIRPTPPDGA
jgi:hypothetical protein